MKKLVHKFSIVYLSCGDRTEVFRSIGDVPEDARQRIATLARSSQVETLIIANERGRHLLESEGWNRKPEPKQGFRLSTGMKYTIAITFAGAIALLMTLVWNYK